jgi:hypothetical protein
MLAVPDPIELVEPELRVLELEEGEVELDVEPAPERVDEDVPELPLVELDGVVAPVEDEEVEGLVVLLDEELGV